MSRTGLRKPYTHSVTRKSLCGPRCGGSNPAGGGILTERAQRAPHPNLISTCSEGPGMLWLIVVILVILWALGYFAFNLGAVLHILLVIAVIVLIVRLIQGRRVV